MGQTYVEKEGVIVSIIGSDIVIECYGNSENKY